MCGIAGIIDFTASSDTKTTVKKMTDVIIHRGPDSEGHFSSGDHKVNFGHRRLAILDLSEAGIQPMTFFNLTITYNGEVYNYIELKEELQQEGFIFNTHTDTEVILAAYSFWGADCVKKLNGMWSFAIYDQHKEQVFCSRDRFGIKPFYYYQKNRQLYFSSEIKQFTVIPGWKAQLNKTRAFDFIQNSLVNHTSETLFDQVFELRGGHNLIADLRSENFRIERYYQPGEPIQREDPKIELEQIKDFKDLMTDAIKLALRSDVKVGSALSGGIDSSIIAGVSSELLETNGRSDNQECVSACFTGDKIDESSYIDALSAQADIKVHKVYPNFNDFLQNLDKIVWHQDEPFGTLSIYAQHTVFREAAKNKITVMLDGQGADEILAGYSSFYKPYLKSLLKSKPLKSIKLVIDYIRIHKEHDLDLIFKQLFRPKQRIEMFTKEFKEQVKQPFVRPTETSIEDCSFNHLTGYGLHSLLRYEDRNSMAYSIESRVPFLDFRIVEASLNLDNDLKIKNGVRKYILREAFKDKLPAVIYKRYDKLGFPTPQERWTDENKETFTGLLSEAQAIFHNKIVSKEKIEDLKNRVDSLNKQDIFTGWRIILFSRWVKAFNVPLD